LLHEGFDAPLEGAAVLQEVARASNALLVEVVVDVAWASELVRGRCGGPIFLAWSPFAPWARASTFGWCRVPSVGEVARVAAVPVVVVPPGEGYRDLIWGVAEQTTCIAVFSLATRVTLESRVSRIVIFIDSVSARSLDGVLAISPIIDDFHQATHGFRLQATELLSEISPE
jgi:hypothetical protein